MKLTKTHIVIIVIVIVAIFAYFVFFNEPKVVKKAKKYIGQTEITAGSQEKGFADPFFEMKMKKAGWQYGYDWCAIFVKSVVIDSVPKSKKGIIDKILTPSTQLNYKNLLEAVNKYRWIKKYDKPVKGAIVTWQSIADGSKGHTGIVEKVKGSKFYTIEGNISTDRGKDGVSRKTHDLSEINKTSGLKLKRYFFKIK